MVALLLAQESAAATGSLIAILIAVFVACALISIIPCWILSSKGYDGSAMFGMFMLSFFCSWPIGLCVALIMPDKRHLQGHAPMQRRRAPRVRKRPPQPVQPWGAPAPAPPTANAPSPQVLLPGFIRCPRCGEQANPSLAACWNCKLPFRAEDPAPLAPPESLPEQMPTRPSETDSTSFDESGAQDPGDADATPVAPLATNEPAMQGKVADSDATPIMGTPVSSEAADVEIKVRCKACNKRYSGSAAKLSRLRSCPRCKASPFETEQLPL
ncbi:MAG: hypothetical protein KDB90_17705 [Planctomycetes bacterium]|nr:hypothetical protein [Planctomycetota bacterium]